MFKKIGLVFLVLFFRFVAAQGTDILTNDTVIKMVQAGVPSTAIIRTIAAAEHTHFQFQPVDVAVLQRAKVPDDVFKAMVSKDSVAARASDVKEPTPPKQAVRPQKAAIEEPVPAKPLEPPTFVVKGLTPETKGGKAVKIHGYVTSLVSPDEFEIDDYRITKDATVTLELEKSEDPEEKATFDPTEIRIGTEMEIRGDLEPVTNHLTARSIKISLDEHLHIKRTALLEVLPDLNRIGSAWEGKIHMDGQRVVINESTAVTIKPNDSQRKAVKAALKATKKLGQSQKVSESGVEEDDGPGVALNRTDQIRGNTFVSYQGIRQKDGTILATKVEFAENELTAGEARLWKSLTPKVKEASYSAGKPGELRIQTRKLKLVPNEEVQSYIRRLGTALIPKFQREMPMGDPQKIPFQFFVVDQKVPNASAYPNGTVIVHSGIITALENEAQLAAVLSHEISHATEEHTYRQSQFHKKVRMAIAIGGAVGAAYGGRAVADLTNLTLGAIRNGYQRSLENQADRVGMGYMVNAGYDPREAPRVWKVMGMKFGDGPTDFFWSDHDNDTTRRSYLMAELKNNYAEVDFTSYKRNSDQFMATVNTLNGLYAAKGKKSKVATFR
jgi:hypothetical protein